MRLWANLNYWASSTGPGLLFSFIIFILYKKNLVVRGIQTQIVGVEEKDTDH